jgi:nucleotide-binding universal stress UspA family protein
VYRKATTSEEIMGKAFTKKEESKLAGLLQKAKDKLVENGFDPHKIDIELVAESYSTITDGIIEQFKKRDFDMVLIGRKRMSKAEEFVMGDISVKLVRALENGAVLVVKSP